MGFNTASLRAIYTRRLKFEQFGSKPCRCICTFLLANSNSGRGPDVIFDPVGGQYAEPAFRSIAWRGRYLVIGFAAGPIPALPWNLPLLKGASIMGVFWGEFAKREPKANLGGIMEMMGWMAEGKINPLISRTYSLDETPQALNDLLARRATGKLVIVP